MDGWNLSKWWIFDRLVKKRYSHLTHQSVKNQRQPPSKPNLKACNSSEWIDGVSKSVLRKSHHRSCGRPGGRPQLASLLEFFGIDRNKRLQIFSCFPHQTKHTLFGLTAPREAKLPSPLIAHRSLAQLERTNACLVYEHRLEYFLSSSSSFLHKKIIHSMRLHYNLPSSSSWTNEWTNVDLSSVFRMARLQVVRVMGSF